MNSWAVHFSKSLLMGICTGLQYLNKQDTDLELAAGAYRLQVSRHIDGVRQNWDAVVDNKQFFLSSPFLSGLEMSPPQGIDFVYLVFFKDLEPVGVAYCQTFTFDAYESLKASLEGKATKWYDPIRKMVARTIRFRTLVCGNLLFSGPHAYHFNDPDIDAPTLVGEALLQVSRQIDQDKGGIQGIFVKDFPPSEEGALRQFKEIGYSLFEFLPCMQMCVQNEWNTFDDYMESLSSKYRVRAKRAFKKLGKVERRVMSSADLLTWKSELYALYRNVVDTAEFNMATVSEDYFYQMKELLPGTFEVIAYFDGDQPIAFFSYFLGEFGLEAHFIGFQQDLQRKRQLYLNILYDLIREGIDQGTHHIHFARTASEIKSSVGAVPENQTCLIRHRNPFWNAILGPVIRILQGPGEEWEARHPFREEAVI